MGERNVRNVEVEGSIPFCSMARHPAGHFHSRCPCHVPIFRRLQHRAGMQEDLVSERPVEGSDPDETVRRYTSPARRRWRRFQASAPIALAVLGGMFYLMRWLKS